MYNTPDVWSAFDRLMVNILMDIFAINHFPLVNFKINFQAGGDEGVSFGDGIEIGDPSVMSGAFVTVGSMPVDDLDIANVGFGKLPALSRIADNERLVDHLLVLGTDTPDVLRLGSIRFYYDDVIEPLDLLISVMERVIGLAHKCDFYSNSNWFIGQIYVDVVQRKMTFYIEDHYEEGVCITDEGVEGLELMDNTLVVWGDPETGDYGTAVRAAVAASVINEQA